MATARNEQVRLTANILVEFDGMIRYDLQLQPVATGQTAELDRLCLEIPLRPEQAPYYAYGYVYTDLEKARGHDNRDVGTALAPDTGLSMGKLERYFALHPDGYMPFCAGFYLGRPDRGLQFFAENDRNWNNANEDRVIQVERRADRTTLRIHFLDQPTKIDQPLDLTFGLIATPLRDNTWEREHLQSMPALQVNPPASEPQDRRYYAACRDYGLDFSHLYIQMEGQFGAPRTSSPDQLARLQHLASVWQEYGLKYLYYSGWGVTPNIPGAEIFSREMFAEPVRGAGYGVFRFNLNSPYTDYCLAGVEQMVRNAGARGVHLDSTYIYFQILANELDGYRFEKGGRVHGSWPIFATREFAKRLYTMLSDGRVSPEQCVVNGGFSYPMYAYAGFVNTKMAYEDYYHLKQLQDIRLDGFVLRSADVLNGVHGNVGWGNWLKLPIMDNEFNTLCLLHGIWLNGTGELLYKRSLNETNPYDRTATPLGPLHQLFRQFRAVEAEFHPYYGDETLADTGDPSVYCTAYLHRGRSALVVLGNVANRDVEAMVQFAWSKCGLDARHVTIRDGLLRDVSFTPSADGRCRIPIKAQLYRVLLLEAE